MRPDVAFGMKLRRLFYAFHGRNLRQNLIEQPAAIEQFKPVTRPAFGQDADQLVAHSFGCYALNGRRELNHRGQGCGIDTESPPRRKPNGADESEMILLKPGLGDRKSVVE